MEFSVSSFMASLIFSSIGAWLVRDGKKSGNLRLALVGVAMFFYTYFTSNPWLDWGIGIALSALAYEFRK